MSSVQDYAFLFPVEMEALPRWDCVTLEIAKKIFLPYSETIRHLSGYVNNLNTESNKRLNAFLCDGRNFVNIIAFLTSIVENSQSKFKELVNSLINQELQDWNCYYEPLWVLWKRYLQDILDALELYQRTEREERIKNFLASYMNP